MKANLIQSINRKLAVQFPEVKEVEPTIKNSGYNRYLLTYKTQAQLPGGKTMHRILRVYVDSEGQILKISTSR